METLEKIKAKFTRELENLYTPEETAWLFFLFLEELEGLDKTGFWLNPEREAHSGRWEKIIEQLKEQKPWQYITGETEFAGLRIKVNPHVLIPRPETEYLTERIYAKLPAHFSGKILDVGTGSGAIALALAKKFPASEVGGMDFKMEAIRTALENARMNGITNVHFHQGDILKNEFPGESFEVVVSNPPYITPAEKTQMKPNVLRYEPHDALFVPSGDPLIFYNQIIKFYTNQKETVRIFFEINPVFSDKLRLLGEKYGWKTGIEKDLNGTNRYLFLARD